MKLRVQKREELASATLTQTLCVILGCSALLMVTASATPPGWWSSPGSGSQSAVVSPQVVTNSGVVTTNYLSNDSAVVIEGQFKQFTARAVDELNADLSVGAGDTLNTMVSNWAAEYATNGYNSTNHPAKDYQAMNVGQLKYVAGLVYGQLSAEGYTWMTPSWLHQNTNTDNTVATIGQVKSVFDFDLSLVGPTNLISTPNTNGTVNLSWTLPTNNAATTYYIEKQNSDGSWTLVATITNSATTNITVAGDEDTEYRMEGGGGSGGGGGGGSGQQTTTNGSGLPPRYAVIDTGAGYYPRSLNNSNMVLEWDSSFAAAVWSQGTNTAVSGSGSGFWAEGMNDSGVIVGYDDTYAAEAVEWASAGSSPSYLATTSPTSGAYGISDSGIVVGYAWGPGVPTTFYGPAEFVGGVAVGLPTPYPFDTDGIGFVVVDASGGGYHWIGDGEAGSFDPVPSPAPYSLFDGTATLNEWLNSVNANGVAVGEKLGSGGFTPTAFVVYGPGGDEIFLPGGGYGYSINNATNIVGTNAVAAPQIVGSDPNGAPRLWELTHLDGTPSTSYVAKDVARLISPDNGWTLTSSTAINNSGVIAGTADYSGSNTNIVSGSHAVLLLPLAFVRETTPGSGDFEPIVDNGLDDNATLPIYTTESGTDLAATLSNNTFTATLSQNLSSTSTATMTVALQTEAGATDSATLIETSAGSGVFTNTGGTVTATLAPTSQTTSTSTVDTLNVLVSDSTLSWSNQAFSLQESSAASNSFSTVVDTAVVILSAALSTSSINTISLDMTVGDFPFTTMLTETAVNSRVFQDSSGTTVTVTNYTSSASGSMNVAITASCLATPFTATLNEASGTSLQYSNVLKTVSNATVSTPESDGQAVFYIQFAGSTATSITLVSGGNSVATTASPVTGQPNLLRTGKLVLLSPGDPFSASDITTLTVSPPSGGGYATVQLQMYGQTIVDPSAVNSAFVGAYYPGTDSNVSGFLQQIHDLLTTGATIDGIGTSSGLGWACPVQDSNLTKADLTNAVPSNNLLFYFGFGTSAVKDTSPLTGLACWYSHLLPGRGNDIVPGDIPTPSSPYKLVFLDACLTADGSSLSHTFAAAFSATAYVGWTGPQGSGEDQTGALVFFTDLAKKGENVGLAADQVSVGPQSFDAQPGTTLGVYGDQTEKINLKSP